MELAMIFWHGFLGAGGYYFVGYLRMKLEDKMSWCLLFEFITRSCLKPYMRFSRSQKLKKTPKKKCPKKVYPLFLLEGTSSGLLVKASYLLGTYMGITGCVSNSSSLFTSRPMFGFGSFNSTEWTIPFFTINILALPPNVQKDRGILLGWKYTP